MLRIERILLAARDKGVQIVLVTHDIGQARRLADHVVFLDRGAVREAGAPQTVLQNPASRRVRDFIDGKLVV